MKKTLILFAGFLLCAVSVAAEKKPITPDVYRTWKMVGGDAISDDGKTAIYVVFPQLGDSKAYIYNVDKKTTTEIERGKSIAFFNDQKWVSYLIGAPYDSVRQAKIDNLSTDKTPKDTLAFMNLATGEKIIAGAIEGATAAEKLNARSMAENTPVVAYKIKEKQDTSAKARTIDLMVALNIESGDTLLKVENINKFEVSKYGEVVYSTKNPKDSLEALWVWKDGERTKIFEDKGKDVMGQMVLDKENGKTFAFSRKTDKENDRFSLFNVPFDGLVPVEVNYTFDGLTFSNLDPVSYSKQGNLLYFSISTPPVKATKDTIPSDEKFTLDIWSYTDTLLQSQQLVQKKAFENKTLNAVYYTTDNYARQLTRNMYERVIKPVKDDSGVFLVADEGPYTWSMSWSASPKRKDVYAYFPREDKIEMIIEAQQDVYSLSPQGEWVVYYNMQDSTWNSLNIHTKQTNNLSDATGVTFYLEEFDTPSTPYSYGMAGWAQIKRGRKSTEYALIYDRYDIWMVDPAAKDSPRRLTDGRAESRTFRIVRTDPDAVYANEPGTILLSSFNNVDKNGGFYSLTADRNGNISKRVNRLADTHHRYAFRKKAKNANQMLWTRESFTEFPNLITSDMRLQNTHQISDANPEMNNYLWGSNQLLKYTDQNGNPTEGMLYLPENYDPSKKYPTIIYFYERIADDLNRFHHPVATWSILIPPVFTSNNYVVFIPDILFGTGNPGKTGTAAVIDAANELVRRGIADPERLGLQGQSWAGYIINYIVTQTDMFCCASTGAGVSNMTSAYTGIRLGSGISRMVQYETGQSRIGQTLWDAPELYIENSPLFYLPNVNTPLLLRHSDNDEAVPFSQSLEMFNGLRRLNKPVWLLSYHGEFHNMRKIMPRIDFSIRLSQFFDHYMKDAPAPRWMTEGVRIDERGKDLKLDLVE